MPTLGLVAGGGPQIVGIDLIEPGAAQAKFFSGDRGGDFLPAKSGEHLTDQRGADPMRQLTIMFFIQGTMAQTRRFRDPIPPALRAFRRLPLRSSLLQARRAGVFALARTLVRVCSHTVRLCSPRDSGENRFAFRGTLPELGDRPETDVAYDDYINVPEKCHQQ